MGIAKAAPRQPLDRVSTPAVSDVFDNARQFALALTGQQQPRLDRVSTEAIEGDIEHLNRLQPSLEGRIDGIERKAARLHQRV
jgi:hypothetical protein